METESCSAITAKAQACFWAGRSLPTCLRDLTPLHLFIMLANHACVAAYTSAVLYALWHAYVRGDGHPWNLRSQINYCLRARVNAGSARNQSCFTTAETAIEWACVPARWAQRRRGWGDSREQVNWQSFVSDSEAVERWDIARYKCTNSMWMVDMAA